jgi:hypothetical protein
MVRRGLVDRRRHTPQDRAGVGTQRPQRVRLGGEREVLLAVAALVAERPQRREVGALRRERRQRRDQGAVLAAEHAHDQLAVVGRSDRRHVGHRVGVEEADAADADVALAGRLRDGPQQGPGAAVPRPHGAVGDGDVGAAIGVDVADAGDVHRRHDLRRRQRAQHHAIGTGNDLHARHRVAERDVVEARHEVPAAVPVGVAERLQLAHGVLRRQRRGVQDALGEGWRSQHEGHDEGERAHGEARQRNARPQAAEDGRRRRVPRGCRRQPSARLGRSTGHSAAGPPPAGGKAHGPTPPPGRRTSARCGRTGRARRSTRLRR